MNSNKIRIPIVAVVNSVLHFYVQVYLVRFANFHLYTSIAISIVLFFLSSFTFWWLWGKKPQLFEKFVLILSSILFSVFIIDLFLFFRIIHIGRIDMSVIPTHKKILTSDGIVLGTQDANFSKKEFTPGQFANYVKDDGFYEPRWISVETDELGLRNSADSIKKKQEIILIGDSFAFGFGTDQDFIWSNLLANQTKKNVYNIGVYGTGPSNPVELFHYLLDESLLSLSTNPFIVLLVFEGNDFVDKTVYRQKISNRYAYHFTSFLEDFFSKSLLKISVKAIEVLFLSESKIEQSNKIDIYDSPKFGKVGFRSNYVKNITNHNENLKRSSKTFEKAKIDRTFQRLKDIGLEHSAKIVILYCPSKSRVYGKYFPEHPELPVNDYLKMLTEKTASEAGFQFYDLGEEFGKYAEKGELVYWRDDTHLNNLGNEILTNVTNRFLE